VSGFIMTRKNDVFMLAMSANFIAASTGASQPSAAGHSLRLERRISHDPRSAKASPHDLRSA